MSLITIPFKGLRYKDVHTPALEYQLNNVVSHPTTGVKYIAYAYDVPVGISITDTAYWKFYDDGDVQLSAQVDANTLAISEMIDSGSNASGAWTKFSDGTQEATIKRLVGLHTNAFVVVPSPVSFVGEVFLSLGYSNLNNAGSSINWWNNRHLITVSTDGLSGIVILYRGPLDAATNGYVYITVKGRWK